MHKYSHYNDQKLAILLKEEDEQAYAEIYHRYWSSLYLHARKMLHNDPEAEDVIQELFTSLWQKKSDLQLSSTLASYLYTAVRNRVFNIIEKRKTIAVYLKSLAEFIKEGQLMADQQFREKELAQLIEQEIQALPEKMRAIFEMSRKEHLSYREIATKLNLSEHTVKSQVSNALRILRLKLNVSTGILLFLMYR